MNFQFTYNQCCSPRVILTVFIGVILSNSLANAQQRSTAKNIAIPLHWSTYDAPRSFAQGTQLHIIVRGDTLWDLSNRYFNNPFLWPQLWDANRYIENPHLIYPGDPLVLPQFEVLREPQVPPKSVVSEKPVTAQADAPLPNQSDKSPGIAKIPSALSAAYEEVSIQCAGYLSQADQDSDLRIIGSEYGIRGDLTDGPDMFATGDIVYLNQGSSHGISAGSQYYTQRRLPPRWGDKSPVILRTGWLTVIATQETRAIAEIAQACAPVEVDDYLLPFEPIPVPLISRQEPADILSPETGLTQGKIMASMDDITYFGQGNILGINIGKTDGVIPGNIFIVYRYLYENAPRKVLGELVVLVTQENTSTVKVLNSLDYMEIGDLIELK